MGTRIWAVLAATAGLLATGGCGPPTTTGPAGTPAAATPAVTRVGLPAPPTAPGYPYPDPAEVCGRFTAALFSADTTVDAGPIDAARRAAAFADARVAAVLVAASQDGRWETWRGHRARMQAAVSAYIDEERPPDNSIAAYRAVQVTATPVGEDGWRGWRQTSVVYCTLTRLGPQWRVCGYTLAPLDGMP